MSSFHKSIISTKLLSTLGQKFRWKSKSSIKRAFRVPFLTFNQEICSIFCVDSEFHSPDAVGPLFWWIFRKFACGLGFAGWRRRRTTTDGRDGRTGRTDGQRTTTTDDGDGRTGRTDGRRTTTTDAQDTTHNTTQHNTNYIMLSFSISIVYPSNKTRTNFIQYAKWSVNQGTSFCF